MAQAMLNDVLQRCTFEELHQVCHTIRSGEIKYVQSEVKIEHVERYKYDDLCGIKENGYVVLSCPRCSRKLFRIICEDLYKCHHCKITTAFPKLKYRLKLHLVDCAEGNEEYAMQSSVAAIGYNESSNLLWLQSCEKFMKLSVSTRMSYFNELENTSWVIIFRITKSDRSLKYAGYKCVVDKVIAKTRGQPHTWMDSVTG